MIGRSQEVQTLLDCKTIPSLLPEMPDLRSPGNRALNKFIIVRSAPAQQQSAGSDCCIAVLIDRSAKLHCEVPISCRKEKPKMTKKLITLLLALTMIFDCAVPSFATVAANQPVSGGINQ